MRIHGCHIISTLSPVFLLLVLVSSPTLSDVQGNQIPPYSQHNRTVSSYNSSLPIQIYGNYQFADDYPGDGTLSNPYRISNLNITSDYACIVITNVDVHFVSLSSHNNDVLWNKGGRLYRSNNISESLPYWQNILTEEIAPNQWETKGLEAIAVSFSITVTLQYRSFSIIFFTPLRPS